MRTLAFGIGAITLSMLGVASPALPAQAPTFASSAWLVYWDLDGGNRDIRMLRNRLDDLCLFAYHFNSDGHLIPASEAIPDQILSWKARQIADRPLLWITAVNDKVEKETSVFKDAAVVHQALFDPAARERHVQELLELSKSADGLEIDYENLDPADRAVYSQFVAELAAGLHARGQRLSIVLEPRTEKQEQTEGPSALDWTAIGSAADRLRVMAYFLHYGGGSAGPTAPPEWVDEVIQFALAHAPREKLDIAFCLDGIDWAADAKGAELAFSESEERRQTYHSSLLRSGKGEPPHFVYQEGKDTHQVWYEDAESLREKIRRVQKAGLTRVSFWRLGTGDPAFWKWLGAQRGRLKLKK